MRRARNNGIRSRRWETHSAKALANDMLGVAGSMFGFSDEFMGEARHDLAAGDRQFRRDQTIHAYTDLRMEHLRRVELTQLNETEALFDVTRSYSLDDDTVHTIEQRVNDEVNERITLLDTQTARALEQLNERRTGQQPAVVDVPDDNFNAALTALFDDPATDVLPTEDALLTTLTRQSAARPGARPGGATHPGGATPTPRPAGGTGRVREPEQARRRGHQPMPRRPPAPIIQPVTLPNRRARTAQRTLTARLTRTVQRTRTVQQEPTLGLDHGQAGRRSPRSAVADGRHHA